jgi:zinc transport system ATP-binding protein
MEDSGKKNTILTVRNLAVEIEDEKILNGISFEVERGDVLAIVGPNGAGKSILLRTLLGLVPHEGLMDWKKDVKIGYVPQKFFIDRETPITVGEFLDLKCMKGLDKEALLKSVGMRDNAFGSSFLGKRLGVLSAGQIQRVLVAWGIAGEPDVLLFDEPTTGIDIGGEETIYNLLHDLQAEKEITLFLVSHDLDVVYRHANKVLCLNKNMVCFGIPQEVFRPEHMTQMYGKEMSFYQHHDH